MTEAGNTYQLEPDKDEMYYSFNLAFSQVKLEQSSSQL